jgi:hypothetical protein
VAGGQDRESLAEFSVELFIGDTELLHLGQRDGAQAIVSQEIDILNLDDVLVAHALFFRLHTHDHALHEVRCSHLDALATHLPEQVPETSVVCQVDGKTFQCSGDWVT